MTLIPLPAMDGKQRRAALQFVVRHERCCVQLAAALRRSWANAYAAVFVRENGERRLYGVLNIKGTVLHCLPYADAANAAGAAKGAAQDFIDSFAQFAAAPNNNFAAVCVNGEASGTALILNALERTHRLPSQINRYHLICLEPSDFVGTPFSAFENGEKVIQCRKNMKAKDFTLLYELQKQYEIAEVLPKGETFSEASCRLRLEYALKTQHTAAIRLADGTFAAKAGTNAIGFRFVQLGGVFTAPAHRRRQYARRLLQEILQAVFRDKKAAALFVKTANLPAISLYESLGFRKINDYVIAYFRQNP